ncbi:MAG: phosphoribosylanthranilate isomerase [Pseudomonadota bacterium]
MTMQNDTVQPHVPIWCKICGITQVEDARHAAQCGADAIGLNFYPQSPRFVTQPLAENIATAVNCTRVALFVNAEPDQVAEIAASGWIDVLQFQGDEPAEYCRSFGLPYVKAIRVQPQMDLSVPVAEYADAWAIQFDSFVAGQAGGTGHTFDWQLWPSGISRRSVLAGGLTPANVTAAICQTLPHGVDVSGGVEGPVKGQKDPAKVAQFINAVRQAEQELTAEADLTNQNANQNAKQCTTNESGT